MPRPSVHLLREVQPDAVAHGGGPPHPRPLLQPRRRRTRRRFARIPDAEYLPHVRGMQANELAAPTLYGASARTYFLEETNQFSQSVCADKCGPAAERVWISSVIGKLVSGAFQFAVQLRLATLEGGQHRDD